MRPNASLLISHDEKNLLQKVTNENLLIERNKLQA